MKLLIKNKFFSIGGASTVKDEDGNDRFRVKGKIFSITRMKKIMDMNGNLLFKVRNKFWNWFMKSAYVLDAAGNKIAKIKQKFAFRKKFVVMGFNEEIRVEGDIIARNFTIFKNEQPIGTIKQHFFVLTDTFMLDCFNDADAPFLVALIIAVDNIFDNVQNSN